ncbi:hypothetical protein [Xenorhabdus bovienii]|nr:hypothetical protein [Xenorhabdus bovienii]
MAKQSSRSLQGSALPCGTSAHFWKQISSDNNPSSDDESYPV